MERSNVAVNALFLVIGLVCFFLAALDVSFLGLNLGWVGLFFVYLPGVAGAFQARRR